MPLRKNDKFKLRDYELISGGNIILFNLASSLNITFRGTEHEINKISIIGRNRNTIGKELQGGRFVSLYYKMSGRDCDVEDDAITINNGAMMIRNDIQQITIEVEGNAEEQREKASQEARDKIIENINNNFDLTTDLGRGLFVCPEDTFSVHRDVILPPDLEAITTAIINHLTAHPADFCLEWFKVETLKRPQGFGRPWYSPLSVFGSNKLTVPAWNTGDEQADRMRYIAKGAGANLRQIFPDFFSPEQYERLKNALGDNVACKVPGCYNNYADTRNYHETDETSAVGGRCGYHRRVQNNNQNNTNNLPTQDISDDEYNNGIRNWGYDNPIFTEFNELRAQIFGGVDALRQFGNEVLLNQISRKINEKIDQRTQKTTGEDPWRGREITLTDGENTKNDLKKQFKKWIGKNGGGLNDTLLAKKTEVVWLMKDLLENGNTPPPPSNDLSALRQQAIQAIKNALNRENFNLTNSNWESQIQTANSPETIKQIYEMVLAEIDNKRQEQQNAQKIDDLLRQGQATNDPQQLASIFKQIQNLSNTNAYRSKKSEIDTLEKKLQDLDPQKYQESTEESIQEQLTDNEVKEEDLSTENQKKWQQLKNNNGKLTPQQVKDFKDEIAKDINQKAAENELDKLLVKYQQAQTPNQKNLIKNEILKFINGNEYQKKAYQNKSKAVNEILGLGEQTQNNASPDSFPWHIVIPIFVVGALVIVGAIMLIFSKEKAKKKKKLI